MNATVSVIIPAYNAAGFIARAINSVLAQTSPAMEIITIDDCSVDNTRAVLNSFAASHPSVKVLALPRNGGPAAARNAGFAAARGDWLAVLDADDAFAPGRLAALTAFGESTGADFVADDLAFYDATAGRVTGNGNVAASPETSVSLHDFLANNLASGTSMDWGLLKPVFRRAAIISHAISYNETISHGEDFRLVVDLLLSGATFRILPEPLYLYTQRWGAVSGKPSGLTRTNIAYGKLSDAALALAADPRIAGQPELVALLKQRSVGLRRLDDGHFISSTLHAGQFGRLFARMRKNPRLLALTARQAGRALKRRLR
jgi:succinoglycan biosynthesis protein ExoO